MLFRFLLLVHVCAAFPLKCPEQAQWTIRAKSHCADQSKYSCLKNDLISGYSENCTIFDFLQPGRRIVLRGGLDADICSSERYQPWPITFFTNISSNCIFHKSACNEEGQVVYDNGNRSTDVTCRCDYTRGYEFCIKPRNPCFCVPSEEDCSCYLKMCQVLSQDNECILLKKTMSTNQCKPIIVERNNKKRNKSDTEFIVKEKQTFILEEYRTEVTVVTCLFPPVILVLIIIKTIASRRFKKKYKMLIEKQTKDKTVMERCSQILNEGRIKRYDMPIQILGKHNAGKTSLKHRITHEPFQKVLPFDEKDIETKCKVDINNGEWTFCEGETPDERIGKAIRKQPEELDIIFQSLTNNIDGAQEIQRISHSPETTMQHNQTEGVKTQSTHAYRDSTKTSRVNSKNRFDSCEVSRSAHQGNITKQTKTLTIENETTETVLENGCKDKVSQREYADCIIMDFAGHNEYYLTHQSFLTKHAIYLVVFSLTENNPFTEDVDETEKLSVWIDNIHCYASQSNIQDKSTDSISPSIIMICTGEDTIDDQKILDQKKRELNKSFTKFKGTNLRFTHIRGGINYISNISQSEDAFNALRQIIFEIASEADEMDMWGYEYPVRWFVLEKALNKRRKNDENVLKFNVIMEEAKKGPPRIKSENELVLFLKFQHDIGNLIFYDVDGLKDYVVLNPSWLLGAFKCIICANEFKQFSTQRNSIALQKFAETGKISTDLCKRLFEDKSKEHAIHTSFVLGVMEKFDIIVQFDNTSFICPSGISMGKDEKESDTFKGLCEEFNINTNTCFISPWLCMEFDFLPPSLYNLLLVFCLRDTSFEHPRLYPNMGIFCIQESNGRDKFILCKSKNTIKIQIVQSTSKNYKFSGQNTEKKSKGRVLFINISNKIDTIKARYDIYLKYELSITCGDAPCIPVGLSSRKHLARKQWCDLHEDEHNLKDLFRFWFQIYEQTSIPEGVIEKINNQKENISTTEESLHQAQIPVEYNLQVSVYLRENIRLNEKECRQITDCSRIGNRLVFTDCSFGLFICNTDCTDVHSIPLTFKPYYISEVDSNTAAVSCPIDSTILIINISTGSVTGTIKTSSHCYGLSYDEDKLYVVVGCGNICVMDLTGKVIRKILLPLDTYTNIKDITVYRDKFVCIDRTSIYCCSLDGKEMWKFENFGYGDLRRVTADSEGNVYMTNYYKKTVIVVSNNGKHYREILTDNNELKWPCGIYFDRKENLLFVSNEHDGRAFLYDIKMK